MDLLHALWMTFVKEPYFSLYSVIKRPITRTHKSWNKAYKSVTAMLQRFREKRIIRLFFLFMVFFIKNIDL